MRLPRSSGILLHPTSLPGNHGIGSFDAWTRRWIDFLVESGQSIWQVLPLGPTSYGDSPYQSFSSHAGNTNLIGLGTLADDGLLDPELLKVPQQFNPERVDYCAMHEWKRPVLQEAAKVFKKRATDEQMNSYREFVKEEKHWLDDYALFMAIKESQGFQSWQEWPKGLKRADKKPIESFKKKHRAAIEIQKVCQWFFFDQWRRVKEYANDRGVKIMGDLPIFVALDSADAWCNPQMFHFDDNLNPTVVAGVPPDYFSEDGQLWGNPLYDWEKHKKTRYKWWFARIRSAMRMYDILRIDHFRGFSAYWEVPAKAETAKDGRWVNGPGSHFFEKLLKEFPDLPLVAEDLGEITPDVIQLRDKFEFPGMLVLQFAFGGDPNNKFLPHNHERNFVCYAGTHDNDTILGWYFGSSSPEERGYFRTYTGCDNHSIGNAMVRSALNSVADTSILCFQDLLGLGSEARMNTPSKSEGNWAWRFLPERVTPELVVELRRLTHVSGRLRL